MNRAKALFREALPRLDALREKAPLVHCMTGAVSVNFCANAVLALGARPICAEHPAESAEIAVQAAANQQKSDGDAATWLPSNKSFRCQYIARQVAVKRKYRLWVTEAEKSAMSGILEKCVEVN